MALITLKCVNCGDNMYTDDTKQKAFCGSCGAENLITQDIINVNNTYNQTTNIGTQNVTQNITAKLGKDIDELLKDGETFIKLRDYIRAFEVFDRATKLKPSDYRGWLGLAYAVTQNFDYYHGEGDSDYGTAVVKNPGSDMRSSIERAYAVVSPEQKGILDKACFIIKNGVLIRYIGHATNIIIPDVVTKIGRGAFSANIFTIEAITIPDSVKEICYNAFFNCIGIKEIIIPDSVTNVENGAFSCWGKKQIISVNKKNSKKWKGWDKWLNAKIVYR